MAKQHELRLAATVIAILMVASLAGARQPERRLEPAPTSPDHKKVTGILTDRLTESQMKDWESIVRIVMARDREGRPVHPRLYELYQQADTSGHAIVITMAKSNFAPDVLGSCKIESGADSTKKATALIRLNLGMIARARVNERNRRADGFIPFAGLGRIERRAEVLAHELTHAVLLLTDADYLGLYRERRTMAYSSSPDSQSIDRLTSLIEGPAEAAEREVWRELKAGRRSKAWIRDWPVVAENVIP